MKLAPGYALRQDAKDGRWRLWEYEPQALGAAWYGEATTGRSRLVRDPDTARPLPRFETEQEAEAFLLLRRWGRLMMGWRENS